MAEISFHYPNPLTPGSEGYKFKLRLKYNGEDFQLDFSKEDYACISYKINGWQTKPLLPGPWGLKTLTEWIEEHPVYNLGLGDGNAEIAVRDCALLSADQGLLLYATEKHPLNTSIFSFFAASDGQNNGKNLLPGRYKLGN